MYDIEGYNEPVFLKFFFNIASQGAFLKKYCFS